MLARGLRIFSYMTRRVGAAERKNRKPYCRATSIPMIRHAYAQARISMRPQNALSPAIADGSWRLRAMSGLPHNELSRSFQPSEKPRAGSYCPTSLRHERALSVQGKSILMQAMLITVRSGVREHDRR